MDYRKIARYIPLRVMQDAIALNAKSNVRKYNDLIVIEYHGADNIIEIHKRENYQIYYITSTEVFAHANKVIFAKRAWDTQLSTRTQDREFIRFSVSEYQQ